MKELIYHRRFLPALRSFGPRPTVAIGSYEATLDQHADRVFRLSHALANQLGVGRSDRFAVMALNGHEYLELYHAAFLGAGIINPLNLRLAGKELDYILRDSGTEVVFVDQHFAEALEQAVPSGSDSPIRHRVLIGDGDAACDLRYEDLLAAAEPVVPEEPEENDPVVLMYTGGTTGLPKGVLLDQRAEMLNVYHFSMAFPYFNPGEVILIQTPMFHAASMAHLLAAPVSGCKFVMLPTFDPGGGIAEIERHGVTHTGMVPTMVTMTLNHPDFEPERLQTLKSFVYGASPMPAAVLDQLLTLFPEMELSQGYGMTESSSLLTCLPPAEHVPGAERLRSVGRPVPGVALSIQDDDGNHLGPGETGEVCAKAGNFMIEYWNKPEATEEVFEGGWYHTGDAGYVDEEGFLFLVDRVKDMIVSGGENVYSAEVENAISTHPAVLQVAVIGIPDETWGEAVHAIVVPHEGAEVSEAEIISHAREAIAGYKVPKSVEFRSEPLPLSGALKVLKRELREPYWKGHDKRIG